MRFERGQRVALIHTTDPHTDLHPGDQGAVHRHDIEQQQVQVIWDSGSTRPIRLGNGDEIAPVTPSVTADDDAESARDAARDAIRAAGASHGKATAEWWLRNTTSGRAIGTSAATARHILTGINDGDPAVLGTFPNPDAGRTDGIITGPDRTAETVAGEQQHAELAYTEGFRDALTDTIGAACRRRLHPRGDERDLSHLHPDRVRLGSVGVFSGSWNDTNSEAGFVLSAGYVGTLIGRWNGFAVFACTRAVAEAIVADQHTVRDRHRAELTRAGVDENDLDRLVDEAFSRMWWDGDTIVVDSTAIDGDLEAVDRITVDGDGRYTIVGWSWCWDAVDPYECARIVGDIPEPGAQCEWTMLTHVPHTRVGPDAFQLTDLIARDHEPGYDATLRHHGEPVAEAIGVAVDLTVPADPDLPARLGATTGRFDADRWQAYVAAACRRGEAMTEAALLDALAIETLIDHAAGNATAADSTLARVLDDDGDIRNLYLVTVAVIGPHSLTALRQRLRPVTPDPHGVNFEYWNGSTWLYLMHADPDRPKRR